ncbi:tetratricopeptide repeat protein [Candidatus Obscuribacterales bacterium]|nr:tetratricopeptide repeat protein [Candidatus Obscuribacterales bacterium]
MQRVDWVLPMTFLLLATGLLAVVAVCFASKSLSTFLLKLRSTRFWKLSVLSVLLLFLVGLIWGTPLSGKKHVTPKVVASVNAVRNEFADDSRVEDVSAQLPTRNVLDREPVDCSWHGEAIDLDGATRGEPSAAEIDDTVVVMDHDLLTDPHNSKKLVNLGWALIRLGDTDSAFEYFDRALKANPSSIVYAERAWAFAYLGRRSEALREARRALRAKPTNKLALACVKYIGRGKLSRKM